jgi:hypothetical protein
MDFVAWGQRCSQRVAPWKKQYWLDKFKPDSAIPIEGLTELALPGAVLHGCAELSNLNHWQEDPIAGLESYCSISELMLKSPGFPPPLFLQTMLRLIDAYAVKKERKQIHSVGWRADCLSGMWNDMVPLKGRAWQAKSKWEEFSNHLVMKSALHTGRSPLTASIMKDNYWNDGNLELLELFLTTDVSHWSDELGKTIYLLETMKSSTMCRMDKVAMEDEKILLRQALRLDLMQQAAKDFPRVLTWYENWMATLDYVVSLGDPLLAEKFDLGATAVKAGFPSAIGMINLLRKAQKASKRHPHVMHRDKYLAKTPIYLERLGSILVHIGTKFG